MKNSAFLTLCIASGVIFYFALSFLDVSYWAFFLLLPVLTYVQLCAANRYSFRKSLDFEPLPVKGYESRLADLGANERIWNSLGFKKFDEFYLRLSNDVVGFVYQHENYPVVACDYHFGSVRACDLVTRFKDGYSLDTASSASAGLIPRPAERMLQSFPGLTIDELLARHLEAGLFLHERGLRIEKIYLSDFREEFLKDYHLAGNEIGGALGPIKLFYWSATDRQKMYAKPVAEQFLGGRQRLNF